MKLWKKHKIKFNKNKRYRMWTTLTLIFSIAALLSGFMASLQKDNLDDIDKGNQIKKTDAILESAKKQSLIQIARDFLKNIKNLTDIQMFLNTDI